MNAPWRAMVVNTVLRMCRRLANDDEATSYIEIWFHSYQVSC